MGIAPSPDHSARLAAERWRERRRARYTIDWSGRELELARDALSAMHAGAPQALALAERLGRVKTSRFDLSGEELGIIASALAYASSSAEHFHGTHACVQDQAYLSRMMSPEYQGANALIAERTALALRLDQLRPSRPILRWLLAGALVAIALAAWLALR